MLLLKIIFNESWSVSLGQFLILFMNYSKTDWNLIWIQGSLIFSLDIYSLTS